VSRLEEQLAEVIRLKGNISKAIQELETAASGVRNELDKYPAPYWHKMEMKKSLETLIKELIRLKKKLDKDRFHVSAEEVLAKTARTHAELGKAAIPAIICRVPVFVDHKHVQQLMNSINNVRA
jgi:hypothetical protein